MSRFADQIAVITGGGRGFGEALAHAFAAEGAAVAVLDTDTAAVEAVAAAVRAAGGRALALTCDVRDEDAVDAALARVVAEFGRVDTLINNAGLHLLKFNQPFGVLARSDVRALFDVNVIGIVNCTLAFSAAVDPERGGSVVNLSSLAAYELTSPYGVSKLAVRGLTMAFAGELADRRIRVNGIAPGLMATESAMAELPPQMVQEFTDTRQLVHRTGEVADVVATILFLCSSESSFTTGQTLRVDGGAHRGI
ncbi:MAG: putative short chain dehydrogenase/reductase [Frankiales bacterium]|nr:putative short chain dehydrogenase/reductase [Frankiales bacterium]